MALIYAQNIVEVAIRTTFGVVPCVNVIHLHNDEVAQSDEEKVRDLANNWQDHIMPLLPSVTGLNGFEWRSLDQDDQNVGFLAPDDTKAKVGGVTGQFAPPNVAYLVKKTTSNRPRGKRDGRLFIAGVEEATVDNNGGLTAALQNTWNTALAAFVSGVNDAGAAEAPSGLAILETTPESRVKGTQPVTLNWRKVTSLTLDPLVASQRDRLRR